MEPRPKKCFSFCHILMQTNLLTALFFPGQFNSLGMDSTFWLDSTPVKLLHAGLHYCIYYLCICITVNAQETDTKLTLVNLITHCSSKTTPLPSNRHHRRCGDCLEGKGENYQVCSVQYCVQQLCTVRCTHI